MRSLRALAVRRVDANVGLIALVRNADYKELVADRTVEVESLFACPEVTSIGAKDESGTALAVCTWVVLVQ